MVSRRGGGGRRHRAPAVDGTGKGDHDMGQETNTQAVRYAEAVADDDMLREDDLRRMRDEYCERRKLSGTVAADAQWADEPFDHWLAGLSAQPRAIDDASIAALVVGMTVTLSIRDALIMSLVAGDTCADKRTMMDFASRSHAPDVQSRMCRELQGAFFRRATSARRTEMPGRRRHARGHGRSRSGELQRAAAGRAGVCDVVDGRQSSGGVRVALPDAG